MSKKQIESETLNFRHAATTMPFLVSRSQNASLFTFFMVLDRHPFGHILKELLLPFIKNNYAWITVDGVENRKCFEKDKTYSIHTMSGYTLPSYMSISVKKVKNQKDGTFISFNHKEKTITKKVKMTLFGNQMVKFDKFYISAGNKIRKLLYTCDYIRFVQGS